ncbi:aspartate aminotransferase family protein [Nereida sp. MMG025]|uniref:aspartate aminotransferase family protein n=1 Tax=Nereida sp. MMG025 TaxID=2909981 RepID=UPI001F014EC8|nr:aminotransferase class III-fold pyridoxal phosphate-dependent enzyme [Nereida sp. MMG025]MCF6444710.1 aminotransferase class III-fold pyridoxal phosphate-dependent enzyme [Nereida sp. MMG025]
MTDLLERRTRLMGPHVPTFYDRPVHLVRGQGVHLWDASGKRYLDCYNNVAHVGHCHPRVVAAIAEQSATLNTHTRYLHDGILEYIEALTATLNHDLSQMIMVCTGSEANDIALRMAQAVTGKIGIIATDNTYHGNTLATSHLSTRRPPIGGYPDHVVLVPAPLSDTTPEAFGTHVSHAIQTLEDRGHGFGGMMLCPIFANEGFPQVSKGFFDPAAKAIKAAGGLILCDEVQPGFGRIGSHFWGHEWLGIAPDVVTVGKPMANGYPVAGTIARPDVMAAFREAFGYFNTFGGNPVAAAAALETLRVIQDEELQENAAKVGAHALERLQGITHAGAVEARGYGLFFGIEFQHDDGTPATDYCAAVVEKMVQGGVLMNRIGRHMNTLKMRPPMPFERQHADQAIDLLEQVLKDTPWNG